MRTLWAWSSGTGDLSVRIARPPTRRSRSARPSRPRGATARSYSTLSSRSRAETGVAPADRRHVAAASIVGKRSLISTSRRDAPMPRIIAALTVRAAGGIRSLDGEVDGKQRSAADALRTPARVRILSVRPPRSEPYRVPPDALLARRETGRAVAGTLPGRVRLRPRRPPDDPALDVRDARDLGARRPPLPPPRVALRPLRRRVDDPRLLASKGDRMELRGPPPDHVAPPRVGGDVGRYQDDRASPRPHPRWLSLPRPVRGPDRPVRGRCLPPDRERSLLRPR